jgi:hypothetical protein
LVCGIAQAALSIGGMAECKIEAIKIRKAKKSPGYGEPGLIWVSQGGGTLKIISEKLSVATGPSEDIRSVAFLQIRTIEVSHRRMG